MSNVMGFLARSAQAADGSETLEIDVYDVIANSWFGGVSARSILAQIKGSKASTIKLRVNSIGGSVTEGMAIYSLLREHSARVVVDVDGIAASIATVILMAADEIRMGANAMLMIHSPFAAHAEGGSDELRNLAEALDKMRDAMADVYVARTGQPKSEVLAWMAKDTWFTAAEAKTKGLADVVKPNKGPATKNARAQAQMFAALDLSDFDNIPDHVRAAVAAHHAQPMLPLDASGPTNDDIGAPSAVQETQMKPEILAALGIATEAEALARIQILSKIEKATGKTGEEAHGVILAVVQDAAEVTGLRAKNTELQKLVDGNELDRCIAQAKADKKLTPDDETVLRAQVAAGEVTIKGAKALLDRKSPHPVLAASAQNKPSPVVASGAEVGAETKVDGKTFAEMNGRERAALRKSDPELYAQLLAASK